MTDEPVIDLNLISRQLERVLAEIGAFRDDMRVQTAILLRHENTLERYDQRLAGYDQRLAEMVNQMRAMVSQHQRFDSRLRALEERQ
jgi:predicted secreted Zn-dependent protease